MKGDPKRRTLVLSTVGTAVCSLWIVARECIALEHEAFVWVWIAVLIIATAAVACADVKGAIVACAIWPVLLGLADARVAHLSPPLGWETVDWNAEKTAGWMDVDPSDPDAETGERVVHLVLRNGPNSIAVTSSSGDVGSAPPPTTASLYDLLADITYPWRPRPRFPALVIILVFLVIRIGLVLCRRPRASRTDECPILAEA